MHNPTEDHMTGAEFRCLREHLGLTVAWMFDYLGVGEATVNRWQDGKMNIAPGAVEDVLELEQIATRAVDATVAELQGEAEPVLQVPRTDAALLAADPKNIYPASWHRAIASRVRERVPALRIEYFAE
ncbi:hypothetical protein [Demequina sp.]|uniref:helix-turn-helix domain-containing protein n=1 Tax=Demequina sp. TaxID=2050685 RepID=UPI0025C0E642|nr:hypothetical protein [Demequina sp.]